MKKNILVTGAHRSGTTWTGAMIAEADDVRYVQEPFNVAIKNYKAPFKSNYQYITAASSETDKVTASRFLKQFVSKNPIWGVRHAFRATTLKGFYYAMGDFFHRWTHRTLFKDPIALLSAPWMAKEMNCDVIILIRHPAAFIASLKVKNWEFNFNSLKRQPQLMQEVLAPFKEEIDASITQKKDIVDQGILIWNILYHVVTTYKKEHYPNFYYVRHEDLSRDSVAVFEDIFKFLSLNFSDRVKNKIVSTTTAATATKKFRDSKKNIHTWKNRLSTKEIKKIKEGTRSVWTAFYTEDDW